MAQTKAEQDNVGESLEDDEIKETKSNKENTSKIYLCNICFNSFMYEEGIFDHVSNIYIFRTICNIQFNDLKSRNQHFIVKHKLKLFKCEVCENYFNTEDNLASPKTKIHNKCCGKIFKNIKWPVQHTWILHRSA